MERILIIKRKLAFLTALAMLVSIMPFMGVTAAAYNAGDSFMIYPNPNSTSNTAGRSYIWALAPDAVVEGSGGTASVKAKYFRAGDGIIYEPTAGSLDGLNTTVTVRHKAGVTKTSDKGVPVSQDSDLAVMITYVENGVVKKSPAFRFTGFHYTNKQGTEFGSEGTVTDFNFGTYPNIINVNVFHMLYEPLEGSSLVVSHSTPYHDYVKFNVAGPAASAQLPADGTYYIETKVTPSAERGVPRATPAPTAQIPAGPVSTPDPVVAPNTISTGPLINLGIGQQFSLFPGDHDKIPAMDGNNVIENAAAKLNGDYGVTRYELALCSEVRISILWGINNTSLSGAVGNRVFFIPKAGLLDGVVTEITAYQMIDGSPGLDAIITYDGGKTAHVPYLPAGYSYPERTKFISLGSYLNVESVCIITKSSGGQRIPSIGFKVVNEEPSEPAPAFPSRKYEKPNLDTVSPDLIVPLPTPNTASPLSINEVIAGNTKGLKDKRGSYSDWIEIYNSSDSDINVSGCGLTDSPKNPYKWSFPGGTVVPAKGYLLVIASGNNTVIDGELHTSYSISKDGETIMLSNPEGGILSVMDLPKMQDDTTMSRYPDGSGTFKITVPTPGASNNGAEVISTHVTKPEFSAESGFYKDPFELTLSSQGGTIYYTLDGSTPTAASNRYSSPVAIINRTQQPNVISAITYNTSTYVPSIKVDKAMIIRAVVIDGEGNSGDVVTKSYFVGYDMARDFNNTMVVSMTTDADNLFDPEYGIFPNYEEQRREFERRIHVDMFDKTGKLVIDQDAGMRVRGFGYKGRPQKQVNIYARGEYGSGKFNYPLFETSKSFADGSLIEEYNSFALRNGSLHYDGLRYNDGVAQYISSGIGTAFQSQRPVVAFINGEYWGVYYMSERVEDDYIETHYGIDTENVILIKNHLNKGEATAQDLSLYGQTNNWLANTDFSIPANYELLAQRFDIENLMMYYASNINLRNLDWQNYNFATWRSRYVTDKPYEDGKWRFLMYDLDTAFDSNFKMGGAVNSSRWGKAMVSNPSLKRMFCQVLLDSLSNTFSPGNVFEEIRYWYDEYYPIMIPKMQQRWGTSFYVVDRITQAYNGGGARYVRYDEIKSAFGLTGELAYLNVRVNDSKAGRVKINCMNPDFTRGSYSTYNFTDYTSTLQAVPNDGYRFIGWTVSEGSSLTSDTDPLTYVTLSPSGSRVTANFERIPTETHYISTASELKWVSEMVNSQAGYSNRTYVLTNDIAFTGTNNFTAIGTRDNPFTGVFDGGNYTVSGINITSKNIQGQGLFGYVGANGIVKNVGVTDITVVSTGTEGKNVGAVVGNNGGLIENCYSTGSLSGASTVGGIAGNNKGGTVKNCYSTAAINSESENTLGGVAGKTESSGTVLNCYSLISPVAKNDGGTVDLLTAIKNAAQFASGEVAYLLNVNGAKSLWGNSETAPVLAKDTYKPITIKVTFIAANKAESYAHTFSGGTVDLPDGTVNWLYNGLPFTASTVVTENIIVLQEGVTLPTPTPIPTPTPAPTPIGVNLAANKTVAASTSEGSNVPSRAVDGLYCSRWASASGSDPQWICVDLGSRQSFNKVVLHWEAAYGKSYTIRISDDGENWIDVYSTTTGDGGVDDISFNTVTARYVRMYGTQRGSSYGYSLWEFEVYDTDGVTPTPTPTPTSTPTPTPTPIPSANLALGKTAEASTVEIHNPGVDCSEATVVDGNMKTRWSSHYSDPQWIYIDLESPQNINRVVLHWEVAYGKSYAIQVSNDKQNWTEVYSTTTGDGGTDDITFDAVTARYIRMYGTVRGTRYGYSLWEFEVYGSTATPSIILSYTPEKAFVETNVALSNAKLIVASYDGEKLTDILIFNVTAGAGSKTDYVIPSTFKISDGGQIKLMLWNSIDTIAPLTIPAT